MQYRVTWEIDIEAATPREAAEKALAIQRAPDSTATVFEVWGESIPDQKATIDLAELTAVPCPNCGHDQCPGCSGQPVEPTPDHIRYAENPPL